MKRIGKLTLVTLALTLLLLFHVDAAYGAYEGTSSGSATVGNAAPTVTNPKLLDATDTTNKNDTNMDVWTEYHVNCTVTDNNQLYDLTNVTFRIWEDTYADETSADSNVNHYTFAYFNNSDSFDEIGPDGSGKSHLIIGTCTKPSNREATSGTYKLAWKLHKTGNYTSNKTWKIKIIAYDSSTSGSIQQLIFGVTFYRELAVNDASHGWSHLIVGTNDNLIDIPSDNDIDVSVTANAKFKLQAKGSGDLTSGSNTIALGNITIHKDTLASSVSLTTSYADIGGLTNLASGENQAHSFELWIDVPSGTPDGTYTYTLYVQVVQQVVQQT